MQSDGSVRLQKGVFGSSVQKETQKSHRLCISASTMASCWSGRRGSNSLPPPWQGGALPDELRPHTDNAFCVIGAPAKICEAKVCGEKEKVLHDFRRGASDRNRTNDTGIFSPLLYRLSYRGITGAFVPAPSRILMNRGPRKDLRSRGLWGRGGISAFAAAVLRAGLPDKPLTFRRATRIGLEPTTPSVTGWCSNQLSYRATWWKLTGSNR